MNDFREKYKAAGVADVAKAMKKLEDKIETVKRTKLMPLQDEYNFLKFTLGPDLMDAAEATSMKVAGVGNVIRCSDVTVTQVKEKSQALYNWMEKKDPDALQLYKPTLNSSSFAAYIRERMKEGLPLPKDCINIGTNSYIKIIK